MRLVTILVVALLVCAPVVRGGETDNTVTEEMASEHLQHAEEELAETQASVETIEAQLRSQTVDREEEPRTAASGNLRGTNNNLARFAVTPPVVVDEKEAELAEEQAKEALATNDFEEAVTEMAKFFEFKELRAAGMRARSNELDKLHQQEEGVPEAP
jgi:Flp pilus assembly protein TadD